MRKQTKTTRAKPRVESTRVSYKPRLVLLRKDVRFSSAEAADTATTFVDGALAAKVVATYVRGDLRHGGSQADKGVVRMIRFRACEKDIADIERASPRERGDALAELCIKLLGGTGYANW